MNTLLSSRMVLGVAVAMTSVVLLAGCDRRATDVPPPTTNEINATTNSKLLISCVVDDSIRVISAISRRLR